MIVYSHISYRYLIFVLGVKKRVIGYPTPSADTNAADQATALLPGQKTLELVGQHLALTFRGDIDKAILTPDVARIHIFTPYDTGIWLHQA